MARLSSLSILLETTGKDYLAEIYGQVIENVEKGTISGLLKNTNLSGNPVSGTVEAKRFSFAESKEYGTARTAGKGDLLKAKPVTVSLDRDRELVAELEDTDTTLYGVDNLIQRRAQEHQQAMIRELERAFFSEAVATATAMTAAGTGAQEIFEAMVLQLETTENDYVRGVPRSMISVMAIQIPRVRHHTALGENTVTRIKRLAGKRTQ